MLSAFHILVYYSISDFRGSKMKLLVSLILVSLLANKAVFAQYQHQQQHQYGGGSGRVAPGVPPQHYQPDQDVNNAQNQQQYQQQQYQQQVNQPVQQQVHQQQAQQQQPVVRQPPPPRPTASIVGTGHAHLKPHDAVFDTSNIAMEREHIQEHLDLPIDTAEMTQDELMFHNFKMWDGDKDDVVDGLDLMKYLIGHLAAEDPNVETQYTDEQFADIVDQIMNNMDANKDGITTFSEYMQSSKAYG